MSDEENDYQNKTNIVQGTTSFKGGYSYSNYK